MDAGMTNVAMIPAALMIGIGWGIACGPCFAQHASWSEGYRLAQPVCGTCHAIVPNGPASWTDAPSFESIASRPGMTQQWLAGFIRKPHMHMLMDQYTSVQANDIAAYILSLRHR
jgi:mono/diheme cytochrome c family protein